MPSVPAPVDPPDPLIGAVIGGRWRLARVLGEGGHARVYAGQDETGMHVAIKVLHAHLAGDRLLRERFRREAEHAASVAHRRIVRTLGVGELPDGRPWIAMERLEGATLETLVAAGPLPIAVALTIGQQIAEALARAHDLGLVHRDIKPANVFVTAGPDLAPLVKLVDFGLARRIEEQPLTQRLTRRGEIIGTPAYIAPDLLRGTQASPSIDLYSLGCVLFEMLVGHPPFVRVSVPAVLLAHLEEAAPDVRTARPETPTELAHLVRSLLAKTAAERPADAHQVQRTLEGILDGLAARPSLLGVPGAQPTHANDTPIDTWRRVLPSLVARVPAGDEEGRAMAALVSTALAELETEETRGASLRARVRALDDHTYATRERLGHAVHEIGVELSDARADTSRAQATLEAAQKRDEAAGAELHGVERAMAMQWTRFDGPSRELASAVERTGGSLHAWCDVREELARAKADALVRSARVQDLEFQLGALRRRLADVEAQAAAERAAPDAQLDELHAREAAIEARLRSANEALEAHLARARPR